MASKTLRASSDYIYGSKVAPKGLELIAFNIRPHFNSPRFPKVRDRILKKVVKKLSGDVYALDDESGVLVNGNKIKVISEGTWKLYTNKH